MGYHFYLCFQSKTVDTQWACVICSSITYSVLQGNPLCGLHSSWEGFSLCADTQAGVQTHFLILANKLSQRFSILLRKSIAPYRGPQSQPWLPSPLSGLCSGHCVCESLSCVWLCVAPWTAARQAPLSMGFSRQEYWDGLPFPSPGDLPDLGIEAMSPALQADSLPADPPSQDTKSSSLCCNLQSEYLFWGP